MPDIQARGPAARLPTRWGNFQIMIFRDSQGLDHAAVFVGRLDDGEPVLCRIHSECLTGDAFGSLRCDCGPQLQRAMELIASRGRGCLLYMRQEGRGIGLFNKIRAYELQDQGMDTVEANLQLQLPADGRSYQLCAAMMRSLGFTRVILMTNNPAKIEALQSQGIEVIDREPLETGTNPYNEDYLRTKGDKMGHLLKEGGQ